MRRAIQAQREAASLNACFESYAVPPENGNQPETFDTNKGGDSHGRLRAGFEKGRGPSGRSTRMTAVDALGYLAASLVLATFCAKSMVTLRLLAIASNAAFVTYALAAGLHPIVVPHTDMLPLNLLRLRQLLQSSPDAGSVHLVAGSRRRRDRERSGSAS